MKRFFRRLFRSVLALIILLALFIIFILNPQVMYAEKRKYKKVTFYSAKPATPEFNKVIDRATALIENSELYDSSFHFDIFMNDGSSFPAVLKKVFGDAFAWGYYKNVVLAGSNDDSLQFMKLYGRQRQLSRTIAHEMMHCLEAKRFGLFGSRPLKDIPYWKWEGYPEYIAYHSSVQSEYSILLKNLAVLDSLKDETYSPVEVDTDEGKSIAGLDYLRWWLMIKYCMDIKKMSFTEIMKDEVQYDIIYTEMMDWYKKNHLSFSPPSVP